ncbi:MAG: hypothetical protein WEB59_07030 [Thermoanaerobaculia bacterium]
MPARGMEKSMVRDWTAASGQRPLFSLLQRSGWGLFARATPS